MSLYDMQMVLLQDYVDGLDKGKALFYFTIPGPDASIICYMCCKSLMFLCEIRVLIQDYDELNEIRESVGIELDEIRESVSIELDEIREGVSIVSFEDRKAEVNAALVNINFLGMC